MKKESEVEQLTAQLNDLKLGPASHDPPEPTEDSQSDNDDPGSYHSSLLSFVPFPFPPPHLPSPHTQNSSK